MIKFTDISFGFPQKDLYNEICFEIVEGDHAALIGSNGTGKSTLIDMIIHTDDYLYDGKIEKDEAARIGYIPQFVKHEAEEISAFDFLAKPFDDCRKNQRQSVRRWRLQKIWTKFMAVIRTYWMRWMPLTHTIMIPISEKNLQLQG